MEGKIPRIQLSQKCMDSNEENLVFYKEMKNWSCVSNDQFSHDCFVT